MQKLLIGHVVVVLAVIGALFAADAPIRGEVERRVASTLRTTVPFTQTPTLRLDGYPFAWHALTGRFPSAHVTAAGMPMRIEPHEVVLTDVELALTEVTYTTAEVRAASLTGTARLSYADLSKLAGVPLTFVEGRLAATYAVELFGQRLDAVVTGVPHVDAERQTVTLGEAEIGVAGFRLGREVSQQLIDRLVKPVPLALQFGLRLDALTPTLDGLVLGYGGRDVVFPVR